MTAIRALLLDVGGTLVPDRIRVSEPMLELRAGWLAEALPELSTADRRRLLELFLVDARSAEGTGEQVTDAHLGARICEVAPALGGRAHAVRAVLGRHPAGGPPPYAGAPELLAEAAGAGLRRVLVTNVAWSAAADVRRRWAGTLSFDAVVTSFDVGHRKPHRAMFEAALALAGCGPQECAFVGDSERNDVEPAVALGMRAIRVAIQDPPPATTRAHLVVTDLAAAREAVRAWASA